VPKHSATDSPDDETSRPVVAAAVIAVVRASVNAIAPA
jgi:hypothetical protein